jgi:hypothetical protein
MHLPRNATAGHGGMFQDGCAPRVGTGRVVPLSCIISFVRCERLAPAAGPSRSFPPDTDDHQSMYNRGARSDTDTDIEYRRRLSEKTLCASHDPRNMIRTEFQRNSGTQPPLMIQAESERRRR